MKHVIALSDTELLALSIIVLLARQARDVMLEKEEENFTPLERRCVMYTNYVGEHDLTNVDALVTTATLEWFQSNGETPQ